MKHQTEVLIADSSAAFSAQLRLTLERSGVFRVVGMAGTTDEALELVRHHQPHLVVLDLSLPGQDVLSALRVMRSLTPEPDVLVLTNIVSGYVFRCLVSLGVSYFLCKPCPVDTVVSHLEAIRLQRCLQQPVEQGMGQDKDHCGRAAAILRELGVSANLKGYHYLCRGIEATIDHPEATNGITKNLYPMIARESHTTPDRVERNIRTAINAAWKKPTMETRLRYFGATAMAKPTNSRFIETLARYLRMNDGRCRRNS